jgi:hypothetical protein
MVLKKALLLVGALLALAPSVVSPGVAEPLPLPLEPAPSVAGSKPGDPGFNGDVEVALNDLTRLQCRLLGLVMINQPCSAR